MNFNDAGDLWKGIVVGNAMDSAKNDIRSWFTVYLSFMQNYSPASVCHQVQNNG